MKPPDGGVNHAVLATELLENDPAFKLTQGARALPGNRILSLPDSACQPIRKMSDFDHGQAMRRVEGCLETSGFEGFTGG